MYTFRIYFLGLICHVGNDDRFKNYAALVRDEDHFAIVLFEEDGAAPRNVNTIGFKLGGIPVQYPAETDGAFRHFVPSLYALIGGSLKQEMKDTAIVVEYPASEDDDQAVPGKLSVGQLYENQGVYRRGTKVLRPKDCVARLTELTITSQYDTLEVFAISKDGSEQSLGTASGNECVLIGNVTYAAVAPLTPRYGNMFSNILHAAGELASATSHTAHHAAAEATPTNDHHAANAVRAASPDPGHVNKYGAILDNDQPNIVVQEFEECPHVDKYQPFCPWVAEVINVLVEADPVVMTATDLECGNTNWP